MLRLIPKNSNNKSNNFHVSRIEKNKIISSEKNHLTTEKLLEFIAKINFQKLENHKSEKDNSLFLIKAFILLLMFKSTFWICDFVFGLDNSDRTNSGLNMLLNLSNVMNYFAIALVVIGSIVFIFKSVNYHLNNDEYNNCLFFLKNKKTIQKLKEIENNTSNQLLRKDLQQCFTSISDKKNLSSKFLANLFVNLQKDLQK